jgi:23S rRNA pseudouridine1911/1915/1917 synthase
MADKRTIDVPPEAAGVRLDSFLAKHLDLPRNQIQQWIRAGQVQVDSVIAKASYSLSAGERIDFTPLARRLDEGMEPESGALDILYQDTDLVVLNKPAELTVHPGAGRPTGTLAHRLLLHFPETAQVGGPGRPGIVHRLDKDTTGVLVVARTERAYQALTSAFAERRVQKLYVAMVYGQPKEISGTIELPIGRHPNRRKEMAIRPGGRGARTDYERIASEAGISLLDIDLATGRTHQIRVHLKALGHPLIGDPIYGEARWKHLSREIRRPLQNFSRPALHAWRLHLTHPVSGHPLRFEAPIPADLKALWKAVTGRELPELPAW